MSKSIKKCFIDKITYESLYEAYLRASKNKSNKYEILKFTVDLETNIVGIMIDLMNGTYELGKYHIFIIYEPKERIIKCLPFRDRIVQQWYVYEFIKYFFIPRFISSTCACIDGRGTHYAVRLTQEYMRKMKSKYGDYYVLKLDIKKFFYNIDKDILYEIMCEDISDKLLLKLTYKFIYDDDDKVGIPIGNYTSQYFANIYLDKLDKYVKEDLKIEYYVRYMDDFILLLRTKEECIEIMEKIRVFLKDRLHLELNSKSVYYPNKMGINFCGYRIYETHILVRNSSKKKMRKRIKRWWSNGKLDMEKIKPSLNSWIGHVKHACSYNLINTYINILLFKR